MAIGRSPHPLLGVQRDQDCVAGREEDLVAEEPDAAAGRMQVCQVLGQRTLVAPQRRAGLCFDGKDLVALQYLFLQERLRQAVQGIAVLGQDASSLLMGFLI